MSNLPALKPKDMIRILLSKGFELRRTTGSHKTFVHPVNGLTTVVPYHNKDLSKGLMLDIMKQAGISREDLTWLVNDNSHQLSPTSNMQYKILLYPEPEGGYTVTVPTLPGCITFGSTVDEAMAMAREAIELYIESLTARQQEIPHEDGMLERVVMLDEA
jgi:antitoxin HicB